MSQNAPDAHPFHPSPPRSPAFQPPSSARPTHILVGNDVGDVLQEQLGSFLVLVQLLEEHAGFEVPLQRKAQRSLRNAQVW